MATEDQKLENILSGFEGKKVLFRTDPHEYAIPDEIFLCGTIEKIEGKLIKFNYVKQVSRSAYVFEYKERRKLGLHSVDDVPLIWFKEKKELLNQNIKDGYIGEIIINKNSISVLYPLADETKNNQTAP